MGQEEEYERRVKDFEGYQVTNQLMAKADPAAVFLHCLPRHEEEVADEVGPVVVVWWGLDICFGGWWLLLLGCVFGGGDWCWLVLVFCVGGLGSGGR